MKTNLLGYLAVLMLSTASSAAAQAETVFACYPHCVVFDTRNNQIFVMSSQPGSSHHSRANAYRVAERECQSNAQRRGFGYGSGLLVKEVHLQGSSHTSSGSGGGNTSSDTTTWHNGYWGPWVTYTSVNRSRSDHWTVHTESGTSFELNLFSPRDCEVEEANFNEAPEYTGRLPAFP